MREVNNVDGRGCGLRKVSRSDLGLPITFKTIVRVDLGFMDAVFKKALSIKTDAWGRAWRVY